jgi:hypothetical protein
MEKSEVKTSVKAIYLQAAALAGFEVGPNSPERLVELIEQGFDKVAPNRRAEAVANVLRLVAVTLEVAEQSGDTQLHESSVDAGKEKICPVYPFGKGGQGVAAKKGGAKKSATKKGGR